MTFAQNGLGISRLRLFHSRWVAWGGRSANRRIFAAALTVGFLTLLVKVAAAAKDILVARAFGVGDALDTFLIAYLIPSFAISVIAGSIYAAFVPVLVRVRETQSHADTTRLFSNILLLALMVLAVVTLLL